MLFTFFSGLVSSDGRIQVTNEGRLIIDNIRQIDAGIYVCAAANSAGSTLAKASLSIISDGLSLGFPWTICKNVGYPDIFAS
uniref:Immunoglobulin I-set domain-containing protein n=1 Tax=Meloidogyne incognita TaxID=6306 RepID=A0A914NG90_MELIC